MTKIEHITPARGELTYRVAGKRIQVVCRCIGAHKMVAAISPLFVLKGRERREFVDWFRANHYPDSEIKFPFPDAN